MQTNDPGLVSVVLATYNGERYLAEQIESILTQTHRELEVLVMDDASTDSSVDIARSFEKNDPRVKVMANASNLGLVANFIKGVSLTRGSFVCFSDQDDVWHPEKIAVLVSLLTKKSRRMLAYSDLEICDQDMKPAGVSFWHANGMKPFAGLLGGRAVLRNITPGCSMMFRGAVRDVMVALANNADFQRINRSEKLNLMPVIHDHLALIISAGLGEVVYTKKRLVSYRQHDQNNIGVRCNKHDSSIFIGCLEARIVALRSAQHELPLIEWPEVESFLEIYRGSDRPAMPRMLGYFLWMRDGSLKNRCLAVLDCYFPALYRKLKGVVT